MKYTEQLSPPDAPDAPEPQLPYPRRAPQTESSKTTHGMEYPVLFGQFGWARPAVSPPGSWWKLTHPGWTQDDTIFSAASGLLRRSAPIILH